MNKVRIFQTALLASIARSTGAMLAGVKEAEFVNMATSKVLLDDGFAFEVKQALADQMTKLVYEDGDYTERVHVELANAIANTNAQVEMLSKKFDLDFAKAGTDDSEITGAIAAQELARSSGNSHIQDQ